MSKKVPTKSITPARYSKLFGPAPVLSSEDLSEYETALMYLHDCIAPKDFIEQMHVKDLADATWDIKRYVSHKTMAIEIEYQRQQEVEVKRRKHARKLQRELAERLEAKKAKEAEQADQPAQTEQGAVTQFERAVELDAAVGEAPADIDEILHGPADEVDHAKALKSTIDHHERVDRLESVARARRAAVFREIDFYRQGLGSVARRASDEIIDAEFSETRTEAPSITGPDDGDAE